MTALGQGHGHDDLRSLGLPTGLGPRETRLPDDPAAVELADGREPRTVAGAHPESSLAWAVLSERTLAGDPVAAYAYARVGYHRGLDALRKAGWKGSGPVPWNHQANRGFLRSLAALARAAEAIGEDDEAHRCRQFLRSSSAEAADALGL